MKKIYVVRHRNGKSSSPHIVGEDALTAFKEANDITDQSIHAVEPWEVPQVIQLKAMEKGDQFTFVRMGQVLDGVVTKVTDTQVTIGDTRYTKLTAREIGTKYRVWDGIASPGRIEQIKYEQSKHEAKKRWGKAAEIITDEIITTLHQADQNGTLRILLEKLSHTGLVNMSKVSDLIHLS